MAFCGEVGQKIIVNDTAYFSDLTYKVLLYNPTNAQSGACDGANATVFIVKHIDMYKQYC